MTRWQAAAILTTLAIGPLLSGCGSRGPEIKGIVKLDGQPLEGVRVTFRPLDGKYKLSGAVAETDATGTFNVMPQAGGVTLQPGKYNVTFSRMVDAQGNLPPAKDRVMLEMSRKLTESIPAKYAAPSGPQATLPGKPAPAGQALPGETVEITDASADFTFDLKSQ